MKPRIIFLITEDWYFWSHRLHLARAVRDAGFSVIIATRVHKHKRKIEKEGFELVPLRLKRKNKNILQELVSLIQIIRTYRTKRPIIVHHVTLKPVLYGSLAAGICGASGVVNALAGLGFIFSKSGRITFWLRKLLLLAFHLAFAGKNTFGIFQNPEDLNLFLDASITSNQKSVVINLTL